MDANGEIRVTLSDALFEHLRKEAKARQVPLRWLVAGLICDTVENCDSSASNLSMQRAAG